MTKRIANSQILGELGETAIKKLVLEMQFIYDPRGRLEAGTDGVIELRDPRSGAPLGKLLGVQVKATESGHYIRETDHSFEYLLKPDDLKYWRSSDWVIRKRRFVSFFDPREWQTSGQLSYLRKDRLFYFRATEMNKPRSYRYLAHINETSAKVVSVYPNKNNPKGQGYVRHHAASFRFERLADEWFLIVDPTFYFTTDGFQPHRFSEALLAGKKRLERNAAVRGQVVMWQHVLVESDKLEAGLFDTGKPAPLLAFETLPLIQLSQAVPESSWTRTDPRAKEMESRDLFEERGSA